jgi:hypothetical protein
MDLTPTAYRCQHCAAVFPAENADERQVEMVRDQMHDRALVSERGLVLQCPHCHSDALEDAVLCFRCHAAAPISGSDYCGPCDVAAEREEHGVYR